MNASRSRNTSRARFSGSWTSGPSTNPARRKRATACKRLLLAGLALFGAGSLAAGLAQSTGQLIAARAGMGVGGALLLTTTLAIVLQIFEPDERPRAIGAAPDAFSSALRTGQLAGAAAVLAGGCLTALLLSRGTGARPREDQCDSPR